MQKDEFLIYILDLMEGISGISSTRLFGGHALYKNDITFAILQKDEIYFKVDDENIKDYQELDSFPFSYQKGGKEIMVSFYRVPVDVMEDSDLLADYVEKSYLAARRAKAAKAAKSTKKVKTKARRK